MAGQCHRCRWCHLPRPGPLPQLVPLFARRSIRHRRLPHIHIGSTLSRTCQPPSRHRRAVLSPLDNVGSMSGGGLDTPQRITRSKSSQPPASPTAPGPPVPVRDTSKQAMLNSASGGSHSCNPFDVDLVIPYDISSGKEDRLKAQEEIREGYEGLLRALEGEGLRIATRPGRAGKGKEEIWVFVSASAEKIRELVERERWVQRASHRFKV